MVGGNCCIFAGIKSKQEQLNNKLITVSRAAARLTGSHDVYHEHGRVQFETGTGIFVPHYAAEQIRVGRIASLCHAHQNGQPDRIASLSPPIAPADESAGTHGCRTLVRSDGPTYTGSGMVS